jgi:hypothetical protein
MSLSMQLLFPVILSSVGAAPPADPGVRAVAPFVTEDVLAVAHFDLANLKVEDAAQRLFGRSVKPDDLDAAVKPAAQWVSALKQAGAKDLFILVDPADIPGPPVAVVPLAKGADSKAIGRILCGDGAVKPAIAWPTCATMHGAVFAGTTAALERSRAARTEPRPGLAEAFAAAGNAPLRIVVVPSENHRRILEEALPLLPQELGGGPISPVSRDVQWIAVAVNTEPRSNVQLVVQARDAAAAMKLKPLAEKSLALFAQAVPRGPGSGEFARDISALKPEVNDTRVQLDVNLDQASALVSAPLRASRESAERHECTNHLKMITLGMHNYHSTYGAFPPPASRDKNRRPLLSWRVHILPYIEHDPLYKEFHLDEPWDSAHNKALIAKMPATYFCPASSRQLLAAGKTTYLVPRGKATIFPGAERIRINEITDGTSNTIMVVDANDEAAVIWTKPEDWEVDPTPNKAALLGHHPDGFITGFADGSVQFLKGAINPRILRALLTRNGGEVIDRSEF